MTTPLLSSDLHREFVQTLVDFDIARIYSTIDAEAAAAASAGRTFDELDAFVRQVSQTAWGRTISKSTLAGAHVMEGKLRQLGYNSIPSMMKVVFNLKDYVDPAGNKLFESDVMGSYMSMFINVPSEGAALQSWPMNTISYFHKIGNNLIELDKLLNRNRNTMNQDQIKELDSTIQSLVRSIKRDNSEMTSLNMKDQSFLAQLNRQATPKITKTMVYDIKYTELEGSIRDQIRKSVMGDPTASFKLSEFNINKGKSGTAFGNLIRNETIRNNRLENIIDALDISFVHPEYMKQMAAIDDTINFFVLTTEGPNKEQLKFIGTRMSGARFPVQNPRGIAEGLALAPLNEAAHSLLGGIGPNQIAVSAMRVALTGADFDHDLFISYLNGKILFEEIADEIRNKDGGQPSQARIWAKYFGRINEYAKELTAIGGTSRARMSNRNFAITTSWAAEYISKILISTDSFIDKEIPIISYGGQLYGRETSGKAVLPLQQLIANKISEEYRGGKNVASAISSVHSELAYNSTPKIYNVDTGALSNHDGIWIRRNVSAGYGLGRQFAPFKPRDERGRQMLQKAGENLLKIISEGGNIGGVIEEFNEYAYGIAGAIEGGVTSQSAMQAELEKISKKLGRDIANQIHGQALTKTGTAYVGSMQYLFLDLYKNITGYMTSVATDTDKMSKLNQLTEFLEIIGQIPLESKHTATPFKIIADTMSAGGIKRKMDVGLAAKRLTDIFVKNQDHLSGVWQMAKWSGAQEDRFWVNGVFNAEYFEKFATESMTTMRNVGAMLEKTAGLRNVSVDGGILDISLMIESIMRQEGLSPSEIGQGIATNAFDINLRTSGRPLSKEQEVVHLYLDKIKMEKSRGVLREIPEKAKKQIYDALVPSSRHESNILKFSIVGEGTDTERLVTQIISKDQYNTTLQHAMETFASSDSFTFIAEKKVINKIRDANGKLMVDFLSKEYTKQATIVSVITAMETEILDGKIAGLDARNVANKTRTINALFDFATTLKTHGAENGEFAEAFGGYIKDMGLADETKRALTSGRFAGLGQDLFAGFSSLEMYPGIASSEAAANIFNAPVATFGLATRDGETFKRFVHYLHPKLSKRNIEGPSAAGHLVSQEVQLNILDQTAASNLRKKVKMSADNTANKNFIAELFGIGQELTNEDLGAFASLAGDIENRISNGIEGNLAVFNSGLITPQQISMKLGNNEMTLIENAFKKASGEGTASFIGDGGMAAKDVLKFDKYGGESRTKFIKHLEKEGMITDGVMTMEDGRRVGLHEIHGLSMIREADGEARLVLDGFFEGSFQVGKSSARLYKISRHKALSGALERAGITEEKAVSSILGYLIYGDEMLASDVSRNEALKAGSRVNVVVSNVSQRNTMTFLGGTIDDIIDSKKGNLSRDNIAVSVMTDEYLRDIYNKSMEGSQSPWQIDILVDKLRAGKGAPTDVADAAVTAYVSAIRAAPLLHAAGRKLLTVSHQNYFYDHFFNDVNMMLDQNTSTMNAILLESQGLISPQDINVELAARRQAGIKEITLIGNDEIVQSYLRSVGTIPSDVKYISYNKALLGDSVFKGAVDSLVNTGISRGKAAEAIIATSVGAIDDALRIVDSTAIKEAHNLLARGAVAETWGQIAQGYIKHYPTQYYDSFRRTVGADIKTFYDNLMTSDSRTMKWAGVAAGVVGVFAIANTVDLVGLRSNELNLRTHSTNKRLADSVAQSQLRDPRVIVIDGIQESSGDIEDITGLRSPHSDAMYRHGPVVNKPPLDHKVFLVREGVGYGAPMMDTEGVIDFDDSDLSIEDIEKTIKKYKPTMNAKINITEYIDPDNVKKAYRDKKNYGI